MFPTLLAYWRSLMVVALALFVTACGNREANTKHPPAKSLQSSFSNDDAAQKPVISELIARDIATRLFAEAGIGLVPDYSLALPVGSVTLDGYARDKKIGYEYIAPEEAGTDFSAADVQLVRKLAESRILVVEATSQSEFKMRVQAFLAEQQ